jgi:hypothetical protein
VWNDPGSAVHRFALHRVREKPQMPPKLNFCQSYPRTNNNSPRRRANDQVAVAQRRFRPPTQRKFHLYPAFTLCS